MGFGPLLGHHQTRKAAARTQVEDKGGSGGIEAPSQPGDA